MKKLSDVSSLGCCMLIYGPTGSGKTYSAITLPKPICFLNKEPKDPRVVHGSVDGIDYFEPEDFLDMKGFLSDMVARAEKGKCEYNSFFHDGLTFSMAVYKRQTAMDRYNVRVMEDEARPGVVDLFRLEIPDWGTISQMIAEETYLLNKLSKYGKVVVSTAIDAEYPKWNNTVRVAPALQGQEFARIIHGYFDFIGYIVRPFSFKDGKPVLPRVSFVSPGDGMTSTYMARCNSHALATMEMSKGPIPLDFGKIISIIKNQVQSDEKKT